MRFLLDLSHIYSGRGALHLYCPAPELVAQYTNGRLFDRTFLYSQQICYLRPVDFRNAHVREYADQDQKLFGREQSLSISDSGYFAIFRFAMLITHCLKQSCLEFPILVDEIFPVISRDDPMGLYFEPTPTAL